jgi:hypothetical protein
MRVTPKKPVIRSIHRAEEYHRSAERAQWATQNRIARNNNYVALTGIIVSFFAFGAAAIAAYYAYGAYKEAVINNRPWISVANLALNTPLVFGKNDSSIIVATGTATNIGHSPAIFVQDAKVEIITTQNVFSQDSEEKDLCEEARSEYEFTRSRYGFGGKIILPNDVNKRDIGVSSNTGSDYSRSITGVHDVTFRIVGCVEYTMGADTDAFFSTGYSAEIARIIDVSGHYGGFDPSGSAVPMNQIVVIPEQLSGGYVN